MKLNTLTLKQTIQMLGKKEISLSDLYKDIFEAIARDNPKYNIYLTLDARALPIAQKVIDRPLAGVPFGVKDNFLTPGLATTASSNVLKGYKPPYESSVTQKLKNAGGVVLGKTNLDAWAHGSSTETSDFGATKNPRNPKHLPGGSSGGSAAAVAGDLCIAALGTETAGSIRQPSAWCGTVGLKPTYGRVSRYGIVAMGSSLDSPGPIGKTVYDTALVLNYIAGRDSLDATTGLQPVPDYTKNIQKGVQGMKIGICYIDHEKLKGTKVAEAIIDAGKLFEKHGAIVDTIKLSDQLQPNTILSPDYALSAYTVFQRSEVSSNLARYDGIRFGHDRSYFGDEAKRRIMLGTFTLSKGYADRYYLQAQKVRSLFIQNFKELFTTYDILISPTSPGYAMKLGATAGNPMFGEIEDMLMEPSSNSGLAGINVPCHFDPVSNLYLGMDIVGDQWQEEKILQAAYLYEKETEWNHWRE